MSWPKVVGPRPGLVGVLGERKILKKDDSLKDIYGIEPLYIRPSDAEINRLQLDPSIFSMNS